MQYNHVGRHVVNFKPLRRHLDVCSVSVAVVDV